MIDEKVLVISNNGLSDTESNGRIFSLLFNYFPPKNIYSFCLGGEPNKENITYIQMNHKRCVKSIVSFGLIKPLVFLGSKEKHSLNTNIRNKKTSFLQFLRNTAYGMNFYYRKYVSTFIKKTSINAIFVFGTDAPFLYKDAFYYSKKTSIPLYCYTGEDYCFKDYNYLNDKGSLLFQKINHHYLYKNAKKAFEYSEKCFFTSQELLLRYKSSFVIKASMFKALPSVLQREDYKPREIKNIVYGGNLYKERVDSILDLSDALFNINKSVCINLYGNITKDDLNRINNIANIHYCGVVNYDELLEVTKKADLLLHVEGRSAYYLKNCRYAFSTKLSDYYKLGIPLFVYSPRELVVTTYALDMNENFTALDKFDLLKKLKPIINREVVYHIDYKKIERDFSPFIDSDFN